jgi:uncharacterized membrane protein YeaQ/YmgE (transglycosylase-associated protein family)
MDLATLVIVGLCAGMLASITLGGSGFGIIGDLVIGVLGALLGRWLFAYFALRPPFAGLGGTVFVAVVGSLVLVFLLRTLRVR